MLRLVLLVLYLVASSSMLADIGSGADPLGLGVNAPSPPQTETDIGSDWDPLG